MCELKLKLMIISTLFMLMVGCSNGGSFSDVEFELKNHYEKLKNNPENCVVLSQIAALHQAQYDLDKAIEFYGKTIDKCPDYNVAKFQLGVSLYLKLNRVEAVKYMDDAIESAIKSGSTQLAKSMKNEKASWLNKWSQVQQWHKKEIMKD